MRRVLGRHPIPFAIALVAVSLSISSGRLMDRRYKRGTWSFLVAEDRSRIIPNGKLLAPVTLGFRLMVADLYWLATVQYLGDLGSRQSLGYHWAYAYADLVTDLDPRFAEPYVDAGILLIAFDHDLTRANRLFRKGLRSVQGSWELPFFLGINEAVLQGHLTEGLADLRRALLVPGYPPYLPALIATLDSMSGSPEVAVPLLEKVLRELPDSDPFWRGYYRMVLKQAQAESLLRQLGEAARRYRDLHHRYPPNVAALRKARLWEGPDLDPFGGRLAVNPRTGEPETSSRFDRLRLHSIPVDEAFHE